MLIVWCLSWGPWKWYHEDRRAYCLVSVVRPVEVVPWRQTCLLFGVCYQARGSGTMKTDVLIVWCLLSGPWKWYHEDRRAYCLVSVVRPVEVVPWRQTCLLFGVCCQARGSGTMKTDVLIVWCLLSGPWKWYHEDRRAYCLVSVVRPVEVVPWRQTCLLFGVCCQARGSGTMKTDVLIVWCLLSGPWKWYHEDRRAYCLVSVVRPVEVVPWRQTCLLFGVCCQARGSGTMKTDVLIVWCLLSGPWKWYHEDRRAYCLVSVVRPVEVVPWRQTCLLFGVCCQARGSGTMKTDVLIVWCLLSGPWKWYHEDMLDCCIPTELIRKQGITFDEFICLAGCNLLETKAARVDDSSSEEEFRELVKDVTLKEDTFLILSYSRPALGQTGDGHFAPVSGYHPQRDLVLILDTARFKYPPHWISLPLLFKSMKALDMSTGRLSFPSSPWRLWTCPQAGFLFLQVHEGSGHAHR